MEDSWPRRKQLERTIGDVESLKEDLKLIKSDAGAPLREALLKVRWRSCLFPSPPPSQTATTQSCSHRCSFFRLAPPPPQIEDLSRVEKARAHTRTRPQQRDTDTRHHLLSRCTVFCLRRLFPVPVCTPTLPLRLSSLFRRTRTSAPRSLSPRPPPPLRRQSSCRRAAASLACSRRAR